VASRSRRRPRVRERPSVDEDAFEFSWSGEESLLGTARWSNGYRATYIVLAAFFLILALIIDVPGDPIQSGLIERPEWVRWTTLAMVPAIFIVAWIQARAYLFGVQRRMVPWSVHIGSEGVAARDATADFNLLWSNIASVRLEPIRASPTLRAANSAFPYALTGLHVAFRSPTTTSRRPAGWPTGGGLPSRRRDGWVPVCVIGPMSRVDREHLKRAIRTHAGNSGDVNVPPDI
ncbi:MAG TPA: hypothetical protein VE172_22540, partial [Stackebrandtia sp.]|uniref:hypothetical protein n=1 Tax=Stackebrandtia sp. TaxID=2023065 RepID=UPI002D687BAD